MTLETKPLVRIGLILILTMLAALIRPISIAPVLAEGEPAGFKDIRLSIYPEYDDPYELGYPSVLVMIEGQIEGAEPPALVRFLVPSSAKLYSAGSGPREQYIGGPPARKASEIAGWDEISYTLQTSYFVVEYYYAIQSSPQKSFSADFIPLYPINGLTAIVQQPRKASDFSVQVNTPSVTQKQFIDTEGFNIQQYDYDSIKKTEPLSFGIQYTKKDTAPSLEIGDAGSTNTWVIIGAAIGGCLLLAIGLFWAFRKPTHHVKRRKATKGRGPDQPNTGDSTQARFCTQCGSKLKKLSRFCPDCGAKLHE